MKNRIVTLLVIFFIACSSEQSLQSYFIANQDNSNFISLSIPASVLKIEEIALTTKQKEAVSSFKKLNFLAFKKTPENNTDYKIEKAKINEILKNEDFIELMKINSSYGKGVIKYLGNDNVIDEIIIYGNSKEKGFGLVRILGDDMNPVNVIHLIQAIQKSNYKGEGLEGLEEIGEFLKG